MALMLRMTGATAQHVMLLRVAYAQDAYAVFGWTAATVFTFAEMRARTAEFVEVMRYNPDLAVWHMLPFAEWRAARAIYAGAFARWRWAMDIVAAREQVMDDLSDNETDAEA
jgi:hypothetical protein